MHIPYYPLQAVGVLEEMTHASRFPLEAMTGVSVLFIEKFLRTILPHLERLGVSYTVD